MNRAISKAVADCISEMERGAGVDECLKRHPALADELRPHLVTWQAMATASLVQPPTGAFDGGRRAMLLALESAPVGFGPRAAARLAPAWATVAAAVAAFLVLLGGAAGASAALGGPDPAGDVLSVVGVSSNANDNAGQGGIGDSSASDRGLECANPNAFEGSANSEDKGQNADDAHQKQSCGSNGADESNTANQAGAGCEDANNGNGNDANHDDSGNPGQGNGNNGAISGNTSGACTAGQETSDANRGNGNDANQTDEDNPGQGQGNHGTNEGSNAGGNGNANGQSNDNPNGNANPGEPQGQGNGLNKN